MKKVNTIAKFLTLTVGVQFLVSCDPGTDYTKKVVNQSSKKITLLLDKNYNGSKIDTVVVNEGASYVVEVSSKLGKPEQNYSNCNNGFPIYYINPIDSKKVNISNSSDWIYTQYKKGSGYIVNCEFVLNDNSYNK